MVAINFIFIVPETGSEQDVNRVIALESSHRHARKDRTVKMPNGHESSLLPIGMSKG